MTKEYYTFTKSKTSKILFVLSIIVLLFWLLANMVNVYYFHVGGAIFEILWLPMIAMTFILPIWALLNWRKENFNLKSLNLYSIIITVILVFLIVLKF